MAEKKLPHLYQKLLDIVRERSVEKYVSRKTVHAQAARGFRVNSADVDIAMRELHDRKAVIMKRRGTRMY